jgi:rare lipoprotein A (peptidoglycan hydrolase)
MSNNHNIKNISQAAKRITHEVIMELPSALISAEERLRLRLKTTARMILATLFFGVSGLVSIGVNFAPTSILAKEKDSSKKERRLKGSTKLRKNLAFIDHSRLPASATVGIASWYGPGFHNRRTASGEKFDQNQMMAAHRTLPFGTVVRVTNLKNNRSCIVKITDRGPFVRSRIIDLSKAAAYELEFTSNGTALVRIETIGEDLANLKKQFIAPWAVQDALAPKFALK